MHRATLILAAATLLTGGAFAQDDTGAQRTPGDAAGSSNEAINPKGNAPSRVNASGTVNIVAPPALEAGANSFTEGQVRARLQGAGFTGVGALHKDDQGIWRGTAMRDGKPVRIGFDYKGNIGVQ